MKNAGIIKYKKRTPGQKELLNLFNDFLDAILTDKTLMSSKDENENENDKTLMSSDEDDENENDKTLMPSNEDDDDDDDETISQNEKTYNNKRLK